MMALKFYNTLTRKMQSFKPLNGNEVRMYNCGPTVYNYVHIGNCRAFVDADVLKRYLLYKGFKVKQVMNITDVDDKTIRDSKNEGLSLKEFTNKYTEAFFEDIKALNVLPAEFYPKATEHIPEMISLIGRLDKKKYTYIGEDKSVYYKISKFKKYGKLSGIKVDELQSGSRVKNDEYGKENAHDFALWKAYDASDGDVFWDTKYGKGRPGWHIECSAMSMKYLGETFDIHTGGIDLIFPHHENEIAQSEAATGKPFVKFWLHNEYIMVDGKKMSKSLGNFYTLRDVLSKGYKPKAVRYLLLSTHYRQPLNFTFDSLSAADAAVERLLNFMVYLDSVKGEKDSKTVAKLIVKVKKQFEKNMDSDLNMSSALASIFDFVRDSYKARMSRNDAAEIKKTMMEFDKVIGILEVGEKKLDTEIKKLIDEREDARKKKDFKRADTIREELSKKGVILEDTKDGVRWKFK
ncbi:MAG: cysteine--tRNA ligase [archaeon]